MAAIIGILIPVFGIILLGFLTRRSGVLPPSSVEILNRFTYYFALPPLLFTLTARAPLKLFFHWPFIAAYLGGSVITLLAALAGGAGVFRRRGADLSLHALGAVFGNTAYMGIPLFVTAFGPEGALPAVVATVASNVAIFGGAIAAIEFQNRAGASAWRLGRAVALNPLLVACYLGLICSAAAIRLPAPLDGLLNLMAQPAAPVALFALGLSLAAGSVAGAGAEIGWLIFLKLAAHPAVTWLLARQLLPGEPLWLKSAVLMAAMPVGALVFVLSQFHGVQPGRASTAIILSTVFSVGTLSLIMFLLGVR
ncbi:MAG: AEC family transporter [Bryobacteraceae bacterium]|nr:AEC family transporter [Bryobacteraceae bacterium]